MNYNSEWIFFQILIFFSSDDDILYGMYGKDTMLF
jgi:hypothetical protein